MDSVRCVGVITWTWYLDKILGSLDCRRVCRQVFVFQVVISTVFEPTITLEFESNLKGFHRNLFDSVADMFREMLHTVKMARVCISIQNRNRWVCCNEGSKSTDSESSTEGARVIGTQVFGSVKTILERVKRRQNRPAFWNFARAISKSCGLFRRCQKITTKSDTYRRWKHEI